MNQKINFLLFPPQSCGNINRVLLFFTCTHTHTHTHTHTDMHTHTQIHTHFHIALRLNCKICQIKQLASCSLWVIKKNLHIPFGYFFQTQSLPLSDFTSLKRKKIYFTLALYPLIKQLSQS
jgi:hypothetical protein